MNIKPNAYETIVGLEIHVELGTFSKMFCRCKNPTLTDKPNTNTCPVCLGLPGALPYTNQQAIECCVKIALALNCEINNSSFFERKNYFYPDLAKGFQTSQYLHPFGEKGYLDIQVPVILGTRQLAETPESKNDPGQARINEASAKRARMTKMINKRVGITRVHMEEDTGKLMHSTVDGKEVSLIDFNRSGVPLVEIVTEPDIRSGEEAKIFLTELQKIIRYLGVSDADMEKGHMRLEPNISLRPPGQTTLAKYKVEVKNINSFKFVDKAIQFEEKRHKELLDKGEIPVQETRGWNEFKNKTVSQRSKEEAHDYRYFPEPDIPPIEFSDEQIKKIKESIPELPSIRVQRFEVDYGIKQYDAQILTKEKSLADYFEQAVEIGKEHKVNPQKIAGFIINKKINIDQVLPATLIKEILEASSMESINEDKLQNAIKQVLRENSQAVTDYKLGKTQVVGFLMGMVKRTLPEAKNNDQIREKVIEMLE